MTEELSRRALLIAGSGTATAALAGCTGQTKEEDTIISPLGKPVQLTDQDSITIHNVWSQQTFIYRDGANKSIAGTPDSQFICLHTTGGVEDGTFTLQVDNSEYTATTRPDGLSHDRILQSELDSTPPEDVGETTLVLFEVPRQIETDFVEIVYRNSADTARWNAGDAVRARLHFPPNLSLKPPELPDTIPSSETTDIEVTINNTGGSRATTHVRHGIIEHETEFELQTQEINSGESATYTTTVAPLSDEELTYIFDWGLGYYEHTFAIENPSDASDEETSDDDSGQVS